MSVVAMPPYPSTIPASAFSPTANDDNVWMATPAAAAGLLDQKHDQAEHLQRLRDSHQ